MSLDSDPRKLDSKLVYITNVMVLVTIKHIKHKAGRKERINSQPEGGDTPL